MNNEQNENINKTLISNWELYVSIINKIESTALKSNLQRLCNDLSTRIITCPASTRTDYIGAYSGGLVWHSLNVLKTMKELNKLYETKCSIDDLIVTALFHDIGKIGDKNSDYYLAQESNWHRERGFIFELNKELDFIPIHVRSLWWLNEYQAPLSINALYAISSLQNMHANYTSANELYNMPTLAMLLQQSVRTCCVINKNKTI